MNFLSWFTNETKVVAFLTCSRYYTGIYKIACNDWSNIYWTNQKIYRNNMQTINFPVNIFVSYFVEFGQKQLWLFSCFFGSYNTNTISVWYNYANNKLIILHCYHNLSTHTSLVPKTCRSAHVECIVLAA